MDVMDKIVETVKQYEAEHRTGVEDIGDDAAWMPLHMLIPPDWWNGFMFMGRNNNGKGQIRLYKHGITRRYLNIDAEGRTWKYNATMNDYLPCSSVEAVMQVYEGIEAMRATPSTVYDADYIARRNQALQEAGFQVVTAKIN